MATRKWTEEQRAQQSLKIRQWQPWTKSTGAKTIAGKGRSSRNAFKGGVMQKIKHLRVRLNSLIREQRQMLNKL
jgi:hypothetical protein